MLKLAGLFALSIALSGRPLELRDYYRVETATAPAISPDGKSVVFVRSYIIEAENRTNTELWMAPSDASRPAIRLTDPAIRATAPRWSPDGKLLAFRSGRKGASEEAAIWFMPIAGSPQEPFQLPGVAGMPVFSPDNRWIAFTRKTPPANPPPPELSELERQLSQRFKGRMYDWMNIRADGRGFLPDPRDPAATPPAELFIVSRQGGEARKLTTLGVDVQSAVWRPDSGALAIIADSHQRDEYSYQRADLWLVNLTGQVHRLSDDGYEYDSPTWSPDGRSLVTRRRQGLNAVIQAKQDHGGPVDLYQVQAADGSLKNLTSGWDLIPESPAWIANGEYIYFAGAVGGDTQLFRMAAGGNQVERVTQPGRSMSGFTYSAAFDRMAFTATDSLHPAEVFAARVNGGAEIKISALNAWLDQVQLTPSQNIRWKSQDGTEIEGCFIQPATNAPAPLILSIHGGPHGAYGSAFNFEFQWMAANGYAVLAPNPRGSTGYGEKFLWGTWGGWGKLDYQDVMAGVDRVLRDFKLDPKRMIVTGYSYGGFLTDWIITQTTRFSAAVSGAGVSNWISDYGVADIPRTKESEFYGAPWEPDGAARMRDVSPINYAGAVKTPVLFLHGEGDMRVPIEEAEQMYTALKKRHVPAKFIRYPGNSHGGWPPWDMVHRYYHEMEWFKQYAGPGSLTGL